MPVSLVRQAIVAYSSLQAPYKRPRGDVSRVITCLPRVCVCTDHDSIDSEDDRYVLGAREAISLLGSSKFSRFGRSYRLKENYLVMRMDVATDSGRSLMGPLDAVGRQAVPKTTDVRGLRSNSRSGSPG